MEAISRMQDFIFQEETFTLKDRAVFWKSQKALLVSDVHLGKATHFNNAGLAVPSQVEDKNLYRLTLLIEEFEPKVVYFLGDLFHSKANMANDLFLSWLAEHPSVSFHLIEGNHDRSNGRYPDDLGLADHLMVSSIKLIHEPLDDETVHICGHIHPGVRYKGRGRQSLKVPAVILSKSRMILPAFGEFTGLHTVDMRVGMEAIPCI